MRSLIVTVALLAVPAPAIADGMYGRLSMGGGHVTDELAEVFGTNTIHMRLAIGYRWDRVAIEAWLGPESAIGPYDYDGNANGDYEPNDHTLGLYGLDVKFIQPLNKNVSAYARVSASHAYYGDLDLGGRGLGGAAGIQLAGKVPALGYLWWPLFFLGKGPKVHSAIYFDVSHDFYRLHGPGPTLDAKVDRWSLGFAVGQDF
jgi:hypothetical protein